MAQQIVDASGYSGWAEAAFQPASESELRQLVCRAADEGIPLTLGGAATSLTGAMVPSRGWLVRLDALRTCTIHDGFATVGAGTLQKELQAAAYATGQFFAPGPTHNAASLGGMIATNASGARGFLYGSTRDHIRALRVMALDGSIREYRRGEAIDFAVPPIAHPRTRKHQAGYPLREGMDWIDLFCGSEGTLGIVLEAELKLTQIPEFVEMGVCFYRDESAAFADLARWRALPGIRMCEYFDQGALKMLAAAQGEGPTSSFAADFPSGAAILVERAGATPEEAYLESVDWRAGDASARQKLTEWRNSLPIGFNARVRANGYLKMGTDFAVPWSAEQAMQARYRARMAAFPGETAIFGHIGDAHLHVNLLPTNDGERDQAWEMIQQWAAEAVELGGSVSAEHGLGKRKRHLLEVQYRKPEIEAMRGVKRRLDPEWRLGQETLFACPSED